MSNPFEDEVGNYLVIINEEQQHSLWPAYIQIPAGWERLLGPSSRHLGFIETNWTDMRPAILAKDVSE